MSSMPSASADCSYVPTLAALEHDGCFLRESLHSPTGRQPILPQLAIYVLSVPTLVRRMRRMRERLRALHSIDVTWVHCANRDDVISFSSQTRGCLHPEYVAHPWARRGDPARPTAYAMANGTLSLALKHQLAVFHMARRKLPAAIVFEDDAMVPADLWRKLAEFRVPNDADIFYLGSYSSRSHVGSLNAEPRVPSISDAGGDVGPAIHRRRNGSSPLLIGTNAYVVFARAAAVLLRPVRAEADIWLSLLDSPNQCRLQRGTAGRAATPQLCDRLTAPPVNQYGDRTARRLQPTQRIPAHAVFFTPRALCLDSHPCADCSLHTLSRPIIPGRA